MKLKPCFFLSFLLFFQAVQCSSNKTKINGRKIDSSMQSDTVINRKPAVAGTFYPGTSESLRQQLDLLFRQAAGNENLGHVVALISPHAGYVYSGSVAASAFNQLSPSDHYVNVFVIGSSHRILFEGASIYDLGNFITPLGMVSVNIPLARKLIGEHPDVFSSYPAAHASEHSLEVQLPFLQYIYGNQLQIVPIILGTQNPTVCSKIAAALKPYLNEKNLFIISTDFSHYPDYQDAISVDASTADAIARNSSKTFIRNIEKSESSGIPNLATAICGWTSMLTLLDMTEKNPELEYHKIKYGNSGDADIGDRDRVVGYYALAVTMNEPTPEVSGDGVAYSLNKEEKETLLKLARNTINDYLKTGRVMKADTQNYSDKLKAHAGAFVTLNKNHALRGCIGQFSADRPLYEVVQSMAIAAATRDNRFAEVKPEEMSQIEIEISVLTPLKRIASTDEIILGRHGIYIKKGNRAGTFLPQVADQTNWSLDEFLGHCAQDKAGIGWDGWKDAEIYTYEAYVFQEK